MRHKPNIHLPYTRKQLLDWVDASKLSKAVALLKRGKSGREIDLLIHLGLCDVDDAYKGWRFWHGGKWIALRKGAETIELGSVPNYSTSKDAMDFLLSLLPEASIASSFESFVDVVASVTYVKGRISRYADLKIKGGREPSIEAAARCGALLRLLLLLVADKARPAKAGA